LLNLPSPVSIIVNPFKERGILTGTVTHHLSLPAFGTTVTKKNTKTQVKRSIWKKRNETSLNSAERNQKKNCLKLTRNNQGHQPTQQHREL
jgi:hypothetical protein